MASLSAMRMARLRALGLEGDVEREPEITNTAMDNSIDLTHDDYVFVNPAPLSWPCEVCTFVNREVFPSCSGNNILQLILRTKTFIFFCATHYTVFNCRV
jgi:hypothetical protein